MQTLHICLISAQILPNLIPALQDKNIVGVVTFSGDGTTNIQRQTLEKLLNNNGIEVIKKLKASKSFDLPVLKEKAQELRNWLEKQATDKRWCINITGGTKPMAIAMMTVFQNCPQAEIIYQDTQSKTLLNIEDETKNQVNKSVIDIPTYLATQGFWVTSTATDHQDDIDHLQDRRYLLDKIFKPNINRAWLLTKVLNYPASEASDEKKSLSQSYYAYNDPKPDAIPYLEMLEQEGLFTWDRANRTFTFSSRDAAKYLGGGWLEEYTYWAAVDAGIEHIGLSVIGEWKTQNRTVDNVSFNEFDVVLCHNNQLLLIECKASSFNKEQKGQDIVNKIEALGKLAGGYYGKSMLVASNDIKEHDEHTYHVFQRLADYKIELADRSALRNLKQKLIDWKVSCEPKKALETNT